MKFRERLVEGLFIKECRNRFICEVLIEGKSHECYIPSSAKLGQYLKLENKKVLLTVNRGNNNRTNYSLFSVEYYNKNILLNLNMLNLIMEQGIKESCIPIYKNLKDVNLEKKVLGYKADLSHVGDKTLIIENKGIISFRRETAFPNIYSERFIRQLDKIEELLGLGIEVHYNLVSLSPITRKVIINDNQKEYKQRLSRCLGLGMVINGLKVEFYNGDIKINEDLKIELG